MKEVLSKAWTWLKPKLVWIALGAGTVLSVVVALVTFGRSKPRFGKAPKRPEMEQVKPVELPEIKNFKADVDDRPEEQYEKEKHKSSSDKETVDDLNEAFH